MLLASTETQGKDQGPIGSDWNSMRFTTGMRSLEPSLAGSGEASQPTVGKEKDEVKAETPRAFCFYTASVIPYINI